MRKASIPKLLALAIVTLVCTACGREAPPPRDASLVIELRWVKSYPRQRRSHVETGLLWTLAFLGTSLPASGPRALTWHADRVTLDLDAAGLAPATKPAWRKLVSVLKESAEYRASGAIDIGRFAMLTLGSSNHYYALTGVSPTYQEFRSRYTFEPRHVAIVRSTVSRGDRLIEVGAAAAFGQIAFVAFEGPGSIAEGSFRKQEIETLELMPNGQLRFALYDLEGRLKPTTSAALTAAGKPAKCLWCHELTLMKPFNRIPDVDGYYRQSDFAALIDARMRLIESHRSRLVSRLDLRRRSDHTYAELLYISFMEPSLERLAAEWGVAADEAARRVAGRTTHAHPEFAFLGNELYRRAEVDGLAPYATLAVPANPRDPSPDEPDLLR